MVKEVRLAGVERAAERVVESIPLVAPVAMRADGVPCPWANELPGELLVFVPEWRACEGWLCVQRVVVSPLPGVCFRGARESWHTPCEQRVLVLMVEEAWA